ncbi:MAG: cardiolipin synthase [Phycisphaera sp.]|nr:cardiolipin synthase [Phycisphaera sp.]
MTHLNLTLLFIASEWIIRLVMLPVVMRRRSPTTAMAWLLVIYFEPFVGLALFMLVGRHGLPRRRVQRHIQALEDLREAHQSRDAASNDTPPELDTAQLGVVRLAEQLGEMHVHGGNDVTLLTDTQNVIDAMIADIDAAERHVHILMYIFENDRTGEAVGAALIRAVQRGVACRVIADAVGSWHTFPSLFQQLRSEGVDVVAALPVHPFRRKLARIDLRNHRKLVVIDGRIAYTGSQNIVDPTYGSRDLVWHDATLRMTGPIVPDVQMVFVEDWYYETGKPLDPAQVFVDATATGRTPVQCLPSGPSYSQTSYQRLIVAALHNATDRVIITSPYVAPDESLLVALQVAVLRGVRVDLIVPRRSDQRIAGTVGRAYYDDMLSAGVNVYLHRDGLLHAKIISVDESFSMLGSGNFDIRSFYLNFELSMLLYGPAITAAIRRQQEQYIEQSTQLTAEEWSQRPLSRRIAESFARLVSPLV